jgi:hypothetical protein
LVKNKKFGLEFTLNYSPTKNWKINSSFNLFNSTTTGDFSYVNSNDVVITQNLDNQATNWFTRVNSRLTLPYKIDWQLSGTYNGPSRTAKVEV